MSNLPTEPEPLDDDEIVSMLMAGVRQSVGFSDSKLSKERADVEEYLYGNFPKPLHPGNSRYVSMDVYDSHEQMKAQLLEVFSGNSRPVVFAPHGPDDAQLAKEGTEAVTVEVFHKNPAFSIFTTVVDDALKGRAGVVKVFWDEKKEEVRQEIAAASMDELTSHLVDNPDAELESVEMDDDGLGIKKAVVTYKRDASQVRVKPLPPEEFGISGRSPSIAEADLVFHRQWKTYSDLLKEGYSKKTLESLRGEDDLWLSTEPEVITRFEQTDDIMSREGQSVNNQGARRMIEVYECYAELDVRGTGTSQLHKVVIAGNEVLEKEEVLYRPFMAFVPLPRAHSFWGTNFDKLSIPTQNARTALVRSIIDHALITTNPRYMVKNGSLKNPRELMENRIGGIVNVQSTLDSIAPLPQAGLNPFVFQTVAMLDEDKEERTGISKLSQGLNKDAISKQNSADMVNDLISISQIRQKIVARNFAENFLAPLYLLVYRLLMENADPQREIQIAGSWSKVDLTQWPERDRVNVTFTLGYGEQEKKAQQLVVMDKYFSQDPGLGHLYTPDRRFNVIKEILSNHGIPNAEQYLADPATVPPPQPPPMLQAELAVKQADAAVKQANAQAAVEKLKLDQQKAQLQHELEMQRLQLQGQVDMMKLQLERDKLAHAVTVDAAEIALQQQAAAADKVQAMPQPRL